MLGLLQEGLTIFVYKLMFKYVADLVVTPALEREKQYKVEWTDNDTGEW